MLRLILAVLLIVVTFLAPAGEEPNPEFTVLFTGEAHAALLPCDCPLQPLGGVTRRATLINKFRARGKVILVDAGGWAAGGIYDQDSDGDVKRDHLRTELMAKAMALMKYDHVAWGDDERRWVDGEYAHAVEPFFEALNPNPYPILQQSSKEPEWKRVRLQSAQSFFRLGNVTTAAPEPRTLLDESSAFEAQILLLRNGEESSEEWANKNPISRQHQWLIVNAGRKSTTRVSWTVNGATIANFDYQAQNLGVAEFFKKPDGKYDIRVHLEPITPDIVEDPAVLALINPHLEALKKKGKQRVELEFWTLPDCPFCHDAWPWMEKMAGELTGRVDVRPHFMVGVDGQGKLRTMHGEHELQEARVQAVINKYYPEKFWEWLRWRDQNPNAHWEDGAKALKLLTARLRGALSAGEDEEILQRDAELANRRRIPGTPGFVASNVLYDGAPEPLRILRLVCGMLDSPKPAACANVPACFVDYDCKKRGYVGKCSNPGTPQAACDTTQPAIPVTAIVLQDKDPLFTTIDSNLPILIEYLPGLDWRIVEATSDEGKKLVAENKIKRYPAYLLSPNATKEYKWDANLGQAADFTKDWILLKPGMAGGHQLATRPRITGQVDLFVSRFSKKGQDAVNVALEYLKAGRDLPEIKIHDALYWQEESGENQASVMKLAARGGRAELEDAAIALSVKQLAPEKFNTYLDERGKIRGSMFWDRAVESAGIPVAQVRKLAEGPDPVILKQMEHEADFIKELNVAGDVIVLGENCEIIPVRSPDELRYYLEKIGQRKKRP